jgi:glycerophosphoryl diester phosphodiesterase
MKPLYLKLTLYEPLADPAKVPLQEREFDIVDGVEIDIVPMQFGVVVGSTPPVKLVPNTPAPGIFSVNAPNFKPSRRHFLRVGFVKPNFSGKLRKLLDPSEVNTDAAPILYPARMPYWDSGWDDDYETNEYFDGDLLPPCSPENPIKLRVPIRPFFTVSHHGARTVYPENTIASYEEALNQGANGIEIDFCLTKDMKLALFHDASPLSFTSIMRPLSEDLPLWLVSPRFIPSKEDPEQVIIADLVNGKYVDRPARPLKSRDELDLLNLTLAQIREIYHCPLDAKNVEHPIPDFDEFLAWATTRTDRLRFVFVDVKNPDWDKNKDADKFAGYAAVIAAAIKKCPRLPEKVFVCNEYPEVLQIIKDQFKAAGEDRCEFAWDAQGSPFAAIGIKEDPTSIARRMNNTGVSIGTSLRQGDFNEVKTAIRDRDYKPASPIESVIYWVLNDPSDFYDAFSVGVNAILTDKPGALNAFLARLRVKLVQSNQV